MSSAFILGTVVAAGTDHRPPPSPPSHSDPCTTACRDSSTLEPSSSPLQ
ncbi:unnamed protein product [Rhodiola kirilowii]